MKKGWPGAVTPCWENPIRWYMFLVAINAAIVHEGNYSLLLVDTYRDLSMMKVVSLVFGLVVIG